MNIEQTIVAAFFMFIGYCLYYLIVGGWCWFSDWRDKRNYRRYPNVEQSNGFIDLMKYAEK